ncbi:hypothetical protein [Streptomyces caelestis]|uniref:hypothetical protein n=1 Tax=Streptomyces caelestis TaxID=36816 RepID=UPI0036671A19
MFEHALHQLRHDDLLRRAEHERQVQEALRLRRSARRETGARGAEAESHPRPRTRFARAV